MRNEYSHSSTKKGPETVLILDFGSQYAQLIARRVREAGQVSMAVDEALSNIYRHGYHGSTEGRVRLTFTTLTTPLPTIRIVIEDDAKQVDTDVIQSRDLQDIKPGGLGVHLIQTVMDNATWVKRNEGGMKLTMSKSATKNSSNTLQSREKTHG